MCVSFIDNFLNNYNIGLSLFDCLFLFMNKKS